MSDARSAAGGTHTVGSVAKADCTYCGAPTTADAGRMTLWYGDDLIVVEGVPARVCTGCGETFYADGVVARLERLIAGGSAAPAPARIVEAAVYAWEEL